MPSEEYLNVPERKRKRAAGSYAGSRLLPGLLTKDFMPEIKEQTIIWNREDTTWISHPSRVIKGKPLLYGAIREQSGSRRLFEWDAYELPKSRRAALGSSVLHLIELGLDGEVPVIRRNYQMFESLDLADMTQIEQVVASLEEASWSDRPEALDITDLSRRINDAFVLDSPREFGVHEPRNTRSIRNRSQIY